MTEQSAAGDAWCVVASQRAVREVLSEWVKGVAGQAFVCAQLAELLGAARSGRVAWALVEHELLARDGRGVGIGVAALARMGVGIVTFGGPVDVAAGYRVIGAGGRGYLSLDAAREDFADAIAMVMGGVDYVDAAARPADSDEYGPSSAGVERLTGRERQVLELAGRGATTNEIARELSVSPSTVKTHLRSAYAKLGVPNRAAAVGLLAGSQAVGLNRRVCSADRTSPAGEKSDRSADCAASVPFVGSFDSAGGLPADNGLSSFGRAHGLAVVVVSSCRTDCAACSVGGYRGLGARARRISGPQ